MITDEALEAAAVAAEKWDWQRYTCSVYYFMGRRPEWFFVNEPIPPSIDVKDG